MSANENTDPWFKIAFGELYPVLYTHRDEAAAEREVAFAREALGLSVPQSLLDLGCGAGRHQRAWERVGFETIGLDLSPALLSENLKNGGRRLVRGDMRRLPFEDAVFDAVTSFFTSFGYFEDDAEDMAVLQGVGRVLRPGGGYLIDYLHAPTVRDTLVARSTKEIEGHDIEEKRRLEDGRVKKNVVIRKDGVEKARYEESVRLYDPQDLQAMVTQAGFEVAGVFGSLAGAALGDGSRCVVVARKS